MPTKEKLQINCVVLMTFQGSRWQPEIQKLVPVIYPTTQALEADKELPAERQTPPNQTSPFLSCFLFFFFFQEGEIILKIESKSINEKLCELF